MLRPIRSKVLRDVVTVKTCTGVDAWQKPTWLETTVRNVYLQPTNRVHRTADNVGVTLRSQLFIDAKRSIPVLDWYALAAQSQGNGFPMQVQVKSASGQSLGEFSVMTVDVLPDVPSTQAHHWEVGLV